MERKKLGASLIAVAMGFAFSVGGAAAYDQGDFANTAVEGKLIPYYMAGENMFTAIGIENQAATPADATHILEVRAFSMAGADQGAGQICLATNQFGYAVLQQETMDDGETKRVGLMVGVGDKRVTVYGPSTDTTTGVDGRAGSTKTTTSEGSDIATEGFVVVKHLGHFLTVEAVNEVDNDDGCDSTGDPIAPSGATLVKFATWAILQDVGMDSAFGTEILSATVTTTDTPDTGAGLNCATTALCPGLVATAAQTATVRFDMSMSNDSQSTIYVWLATATGFAGTTGEREKREVEATVYCEGAAAPETMMLNLPNHVNVIDAMDLNCDARGVVTLDLADISTASATAATWSHISQDGGGYRMNMPGYYDAP